MYSELIQSASSVENWWTRILFKIFFLVGEWCIYNKKVYNEDLLFFSFFSVPEPTEESGRVISPGQRAMVETEIRSELEAKMEKEKEKIAKDARKEADALKKELQEIQKKHADEKEKLKKVCVNKTPK